MRTENYGHVITARIDQESYEYIVSLQKSTGYTQSRCVRLVIESAMQNKTVTVKSQEEYRLYRELIHEVNAIGNNINQIIKRANENFYTQSDKNKLFALMKKLLNVVSSE